MIFALTLLCASIPGGWQAVGYDSEYVRKVIPYVNKNYMKILPEYTRTNTLLAFVSAEVQVVNGYNIHLTHKLGHDTVEFSLHVSITNEISLLGFKFLPKNADEHLLGGWTIQNPDYDEREVYDVIKYYIVTKGVNTVKDTVLFVRTQVVAGLNIHVVYKDNLGKIHSIVAFRDLQGNISITSSDSF